MNPNTWYYTLSTISQTMAALFGLGAVFTTLRLEGISKNITDYKGRAVNILKIRDTHTGIPVIPNNDETKVILNKLKEFEKDYNSKYSQNFGIKTDLDILSNNLEPYKNLGRIDLIKDTRYNLDLFIEQKDKMVKMVKVPGIITTITIAASVILLPVKDILRSDLLSWVFVSVVILFSVFSIYSLVRASWKLLNSLG